MKKNRSRRQCEHKARAEGARHGKRERKKSWWNRVFEKRWKKRQEQLQGQGRIEQQEGIKKRARQTKQSETANEEVTKNAAPLVLIPS